jgi:hypothetical protein
LRIAHAEILDLSTSKANATLMAAAPDLLAALERVMELGERLNLFHAAGEDAEVMGQARAAVAKATGVRP